MVNKIKVFIEEVIAEMRKVVWPSRDKVMENTRIVIVSSILLALFFGLVDFLLLRIIEFLF